MLFPGIFPKLVVLGKILDVIEQNLGNSIKLKVEL